MSAGHDGLRELREAHACAAPSDAELARCVAAGDERAFAALLERHRTKLRNVARSFLAVDTTVDDLFQIATLKLWTELRCGAYNPTRAPFPAFASTVFHQACRDDRQRRRAAKRWAPEPPFALDLPRDGDLDEWIAPSWHLGADPARVVLERERLQLAWAELSEANRRAINRYLTAGGGNRPSGLTASEITCAAAARVRGRKVLAELTT